MGKAAPLQCELSLLGRPVGLAGAAKYFTSVRAKNSNGSRFPLFTRVYTCCLHLVREGHQRQPPACSAARRRRVESRQARRCTYIDIRTSVRRSQRKRGAHKHCQPITWAHKLCESLAFRDPDHQLARLNSQSERRAQTPRPNST